MYYIRYYFNQIRNINKKLNLEKRSFYIGTFFLSSAIPISIFFYILSIFSSIYKDRIYRVNKYNLLLLICSGLMIVSTLKSFINLDLSKFTDFNNTFGIVIGLLNWLPFFIIFIIFQKYLKTVEDRKLFSKILISSSIPVIISCILQYGFKIYGPFETLNGLIIWFQKEITTHGVTGLFNNPNYTGIWLTIFLPFLISEIKNKKEDKIKKYILISILILTIFFIFLTGSRNAYLGLFFIFLMIYGIRVFLLIPVSLFSLFSFELLRNSFFESSSFMNNILIKKIFSDTINFSSSSMAYKTLYSRIEGYNIALEGILEEPLFGWGPSIFPQYYDLKEGIWASQHTHNMPLELAFNYGLPTSIILNIFVLLLIKNAYIKCYESSFNKNIFTIDKAWITASLIVVASHLFDITYYEGKISLLIWILLAGLKCIIDDKSIKKSNIN